MSLPTIRLQEDEFELIKLFHEDVPWLFEEAKVALRESGEEVWLARITRLGELNLSKADKFGEVAVELPIRDREWILEMARREYQTFAEGYTQAKSTREYHRQQLAERLSRAVGFIMVMDNKGDNYVIDVRPLGS